MHSEVLNSEEGPRKEMVNKRQNTYFHVLDTFKSPRPNHGYNLIPEQYSF